jgi:hypothetical protein
MIAFSPIPQQHYVSEPWETDQGQRVGPEFRYHPLRGSPYRGPPSRDLIRPRQLHMTVPVMPKELVSVSESSRLRLEESRPAERWSAHDRSSGQCNLDTLCPTLSSSEGSQRPPEGETALARVPVGCPDRTRASASVCRGSIFPLHPALAQGFR